MGKKEKSLEISMEELQGIISKLEDSSCTLEESFQLYSEGMKLLKNSIEIKTANNMQTKIKTRTSFTYT